MTNLLYWPLIAACFYTGYRDYPIWTILLLGAAATVAFFIVKPGYFHLGMRERGLSYVIFMIAGSSLAAGAFFGIGWLVGRAFA
jgi:hypothetical protein